VDAIEASEENGLAKFIIDKSIITTNERFTKMIMKNILVLLFVLLLVGCVPVNNIDSNIGANTKDVVNKEEVIKPTNDVISMNKNVNVDYLTYKVTKAETFTEMGTSFMKKETTGKFVKVYLEITNNAKETKQIFTPRFRLMDNQERKFDRIADDMFYISDYLELGKQVQPGLTTSGAIVFELPTDANDLILIIDGDWTSLSQIKVDLSSIKNIGKDTTLKDQQDETMDEIMADSQKQMDEMMKQFE
jgi:hypothetical protein